MNTDIVRHVSDDGVEFFTIQETGESGISKSGLAILCGVSKQAISKLFKEIKNNEFPSFGSVNQNDKKEAFLLLESLRGKPLTLSTGVAYKNADIVPDQVCSVLIMHYAYEALHPTEKAKQSLILFSSIGIRAFVHGVTGWNAKSRNVRAYLSALIMEQPKRWDEHFCKGWRAEAERVTGWGWNDRVMSKFLNEAVYSYFPQAMRDRLDEVNPVDDAGRRANKQHQHFDPETSETLKEHIRVVHILLQASSSLYEFRKLMESKFEGRYQLSLRF